MENLKQKLPNAPSYLLGNPAFKKNLNYEQDLAVPLGSFFKVHTFEENKEIIRKYILLLLELWRYGLSDSVYNYDINSAIDKEDRVIMLDLGEFEFEKESVIKDIKTKKWLTQAAYLYMEEGELKEFYKDEMERLVTVENLNKNWNDADK